ncbi:protein kinase rad3 [Diplodia corticola]|uniref:non-specific serine/threonine protein kinase n=1 Tax=Diplodia corticola TaxID=236234 RepID=A0A1J9SHU9_9PEZI|nr:protein kinase rad3 [Diplodia corticola]OJD39951.1 protein kinase rad3 [Diplodia corticola]
MARKAGDPAPRVSAAGMAGRGNGVPPPSTIAAQIVDNHSRTHGAQEPQNNALFGQLLQEFLTDPSAEESDVRLNLQLVSVVVEAGFNALLKEDPFGRDLLLSQARDAILTALESQSSTLLAGPFYKVTLPPPNMVSCLLPDGQQIVAIPQNCQMETNSLPQAANIALALVETICRCLDQPWVTCIAVTVQATMPEWIADGLDRLWACCRRPNLLQKPQKDDLDLLLHSFLSVLRSFAPQAAPEQTAVIHTPKTSTAFYEILSEITEQICDLPARSTVQLELSDVLLTTIWLNRPTKSDQCPLFETTPPTGSIFNEVFLSTIDSIAQDDTRTALLEHDLRSAIALCVKRMDRLSEKRIESQMSFEAQWTKGATDIEDTFLLDKFSELLLETQPEEFPDNERPRKRQRVDVPTQKPRSKSYWDHLVIKASMYLSDGDQSGLKGMRTAVEEKFPKLSESDKCRALTAFMRLPCAAMDTLKANILSNGDIADSSCAICDNGDNRTSHGHRTWNTDGTGEAWKDAITVMEKIVSCPDLQRCKAPRVLAATAIKNLLSHINDREALSLTKSSLGQWCMKSLKSSLRELRLAAGHALPVFLHDGVPEDIRQKNRIAALNFLVQIADRDELNEQETLIVAWGQVARVCGDDELNIALLQLVNYLGHTNPVICSVAYYELQALAQAFNCKPGDMLRPFWRNVGFEVFKDLCVRPQKAQSLSDLLETSVNQLLLLTQREVIPYLVLMKKKDVLKRVAAARQTTVQDVCLQPKENLAAILATLLIHPADDIETSTSALLCESVPDFEKEDLSSLIKLSPTYIACDILKASAGEEGARKKEIHRAFCTFAALSLCERRSGTSSRQSTKEQNVLAQFFQANILGIMAHLSSTMDSSRASSSLWERNRSLGAIEDLIVLAGAHVSPALPQVRACLQSALDVPQLCNKAFYVWSSLINAVEKGEIKLLIDQTFSVVVRYWDSFTQDVQKEAYSVISAIVHDHNELLRERIDMLPTLQSIPLFNKIESQINQFRQKSSVNQFEAFTRRCQDENASVVAQALKELRLYLETDQEFIHETTVAQHPSNVVAQLCRSILDASVRFTESRSEIAILAAQCLGLVGCLDPSRIETVRPRREILVLSNLDRFDEAVEFIAFMLESVLVKAFQSATNAISQAFIAYAMQEMLKFCGFSSEATAYRLRSSQGSPSYQRWSEIPETIRSTLTPFLSSKYEVNRRDNQEPTQEYPIYKPKLTHAMWLRDFVHDLLLRPKGKNTREIFPILSKIIRGHDLAIPTFLLPFTAVNVILEGTEKEVENIVQELVLVLETSVDGPGPEADSLKQCSENVFQVLDYMSKWLQEKRKQLNESRLLASRSGKMPSELDELKSVSQISSIERVLHAIPAEVISRRAVECGSYARALFHWEQYVRQKKEQAETSNKAIDQENLYQHLQYIYTQIDEPDGIEGISAHLQILDPSQQVLEHRKAGRWTAAQSWYELSLAEKPDDPEIQYQLLSCLRESNQYDSLLVQVQSFQKSAGPCAPKILSLAAEASWVTGKWKVLGDLLSTAPAGLQEFNVAVGDVLLSLRQKDVNGFIAKINDLRESIARGLSPSTTASLQACHDPMLKLHVLYEIEAISGAADASSMSRTDLLKNMDRRLDFLGAYTAEKQYILGLRRATMQLSARDFTGLDIASSWLTTSKLARKANQNNTAFDAVLHATRLGESEAKIEHSRLLWKDGHHRKAIQNLEGAIAANIFSREQTPSNAGDSMSTNMTDEQRQVADRLAARAYLLKAKWLDQSGQSASNTIVQCYYTAIKLHNKWEKGHYYLGKHYNKLLESDKTQPKVSFSTKCGETARLIIENYLRAVLFGVKHLYETIPKVLTLWLDLGMTASGDNVPKDYERNRQQYELQEHVAAVRALRLDMIHLQFKKYVLDRLPAYLLYTALAQMITRISHPHNQTYDMLSKIIIKVAEAHPQQSLWSLLAVIKSKNHDRSSRGAHLLAKLKEVSKKTKTSSSGPDVRTLIVQGDKLSTALLHACDAALPDRQTRFSLSKHMGFSHKLAPCGLVVPIETTLIASLPRNGEVSPRAYKAAFSGNVITISSFSDDVLVLSSLQRPRKLIVRGSDGLPYGLLCKPKDDLRKDQRLMEFNAMVNRALLGDVESSKRRLDIKTYAVTPLNEECGAIEWVEGLKPMRDIILKLYREKGIKIDYTDIRDKLKDACASRANVHIFTDKVLGHLRPVLHEWFIESFPEPEAWLAARLKYTRSCAVMSIVGHVLGLGDRHGENLLLIEEDGRVFHVDFNCLFDKGLTFEKPELVPFRLTHNMVDAMGAYGVEGPYRLAAELTLRQLRQHMDTLMTILETFLYDPTADFIGRKKRHTKGVPSTPEEVLESVKKKVQGFLPDETVPLSVEGYVNALIERARDPHNLAAMYIGWCAFF